MTITVEERATLNQEFLSGLLLTVPEAHRGQAQELFTVLGSAEAVATYITDHALRQKDYSRVMNEATEAKTKAASESATVMESLNAERQRLDGWYEVNAPVLKQAKAMMDEGKWPGDPAKQLDPNARPVLDPAADPSKVASPTALTTADLDKRFAKFGQDAVPVMLLIPTLMAEHGQRFKGEILNMDPLINHPKVGDLGLRGVYELVYKEKLEAIETQTRETHEEALREEGRLEVRETALKASGPPYAFDGQVPSTPLDILEQPVEKLTEAQAASDPALLAAQYMKRISETNPDDAGWTN